LRWGLTNFLLKQQFSWFLSPKYVGLQAPGLTLIVHDTGFSLICFGGTRDQIKGLLYAWQPFYYWAVPQLDTSFVSWFLKDKCEFESHMKISCSYLSILYLNLE
jgi:hypothetical protein